LTRKPLRSLAPRRGGEALEATLLANLNLSGRRKTFLISSRSANMPEGSCYPDIASVPEKVDLAVIASPAPTVPAIVEACGVAGVEGIVIVSGFLKR
jgi:acetyltransferase